MSVVRSSLRIRSRVSQFLLSLMQACVRSVLGNRCKVKAPLVNDFAMTTYGDVIVKLHSFLTTGLGGGKRSALRPGLFTTKDKLLPVRAWAGSAPGLVEVVERRSRILYSCREWNPFSLVAQAIVTPLLMIQSCSNAFGVGLARDFLCGLT